MQTTTETHETEKEKEERDVPLRNFTRVEATLLTPSNLDLEGSVNNLKKVMLGKSIENSHQSYPDKLLDWTPAAYETTKDWLPAAYENTKDTIIQDYEIAKDTLPHEPMSPSQPDGRSLSAKRQNENPSSYRRVNWSHQLPPKPQYIPVKEPHAHENPSSHCRVSCSEQLLPKSQNIPAKEPYAQDDDSVSFPAVVEKLLQKKEQMFPPKFRFDICKEAAEFNFDLLKENNFELEKLLNPTDKCVTSYGSEFKSVEDLAELLHRHPRWEAMKEKLEKGCDFPVEDLDDNIRKQDVKEALHRGNHKSAEKHAAHLEKAISKEIKKGWNLLLLEEHAMQIPDLEISPMGVAEQLGVSETGEFVEKLRITHDLSFPGIISNESVNSRVRKEELEPIMFGHALLRIIHHIVHLRKRFPDKVIWLRKEDFKSAYRRMHLREQTAKRSAVRIAINDITYVLISLRLPFGGAPCPSDFCTVSDIVTDCINDLLDSKDWDESKVCSDFVKFIPPPEILAADIPFAQARDMCVTLPDEDNGKCDGFIDDLISVCVDIANNLLRLTAAPCTIIHAMSHAATDGSTFLARDDMVSIDKCVAEGAPAEVRICLGWELNTRALLVTLPSHKCIAWSSQVSQFIDCSSTKLKNLSSVIGRLENITSMFRMGAHFLNNFRALELKAMASKHAVKITQRVKEDARLWLKFIRIAGEGISMNLLTFRKPNNIIIGDACEHGLGAFNTKGRGFSWMIPEHLRGRAHINLLEFITQVIQIWADILEGRIKEGDCILAMGDNTSSMGWLRRSNFRAKDESDMDWFVKQQVARKLAEVVLQIKAMLYSQWFKGDWNVGTDSLSRDGLYLTHSSHVFMLRHYASKQVPEKFFIKPLPSVIVSFVCSILEQLPVKTQRLIKPKPSELLLGVAGTLSSSLSDLQNKFSSMECQDSKRTSSCPLSLKQFEKLPSLDKIENIWWKEQSTPPSHTYHRPSGQTLGKTQDWTQTVRLASSSKSNLEDTRIPTSPE